MRRALIATLLGGLVLLGPSAALATGNRDADRKEARAESHGEDRAHRGDHGENGEGDHHEGRDYYDRCGYYGCGYYSEPPDPSSFVANMTAGQEVPKRGPEGARGRAVFDVDPYEHRVCYRLDYTGIRPTGGHIHRGERGESGPVAVDLHVADLGDRGCVPASYGVLREIQNTPDLFYVNLHTAQNPDGAIRGQLEYPSEAGSRY